MATQQYGYGPNVWAPAKGTGVQKFATLAQPGAVAPQFKAENKYKAFAAKAIGEMAYGAIQNQQAKKNEAIRMQKLDRDNNKQFEYERMNPKVDPEGVSPGTGDRGIGLDSSQFEKTIVPSKKDATKIEFNPETSPKGQSFMGENKKGETGVWKYRDPIFPMEGYGETIPGYWFHTPTPPMEGFEPGSTYTVDGVPYIMQTN